MRATFGFTILWLSLISATLLVFPSASQIVQGEIAPNKQAIEEVKQGRRKVAYASWWGFDPEDATEALQAAIDSGAQKVIVDNTGKPWVISKTIHLRSNQEIVFEKGVVVEAKQGAFLGRGDCLFLAALQSNITLIGYGATLRMRKLDYTKPPYEKAEWRHVLSIRSCENVRVYGLTLASSGGDGIYLGVAKRGIPCRNIHIKDVVCIDNYRQGVSVISAENVLMENVVMRDTGGTPPMAGIDFEPNEPTERLSNIVMRNCISQNNSGDGFAFYLHNLNATSHPVSIRLEGCKAIGNRRGVSISVGNSKDKTVKGTIEFVDCEFEGSEGAGIFIAQKPPFGCEVRFVRCKVNNAATKLPKQAPIVFASARGNFEPIGGVEFVDCVVNDEIERLPIAYFDFAGGLELREVTGTITLVRGGRKSEYKLTRDLLSQWFPSQRFKVFPPFVLGDLTKFEPLFPEAKFPHGISSNARLRSRAEFLVWAKKVEQVSFTLSVQPVGKAAAQSANLKVISPSGKTVAMREFVGEVKNEFVTEETGAYRVVCEVGRATVTMKS
ncbi:MAG: right-handed parallel beta-helix repeat-containing protein, partial [Armatimonadota bacterium]